MEDKKRSAAEREGCGYKDGVLPACAPLALAYVPMQESSQPQYEADKALVRGTLFPGLDLPFMNVVNTGSMSGTPLGELMALDFVAHELSLYLNTHKNDTEAFSAYQSVLRLEAEGRKRFVALYGPVTKGDLAEAKSYTWLNNPWPWESAESTEG